MPHYTVDTATFILAADLPEALEPQIRQLLGMSRLNLIVLRDTPQHQPFLIEFYGRIREIAIAAVSSPQQQKELTDRATLAITLSGGSVVEYSTTPLDTEYLARTQLCADRLFFARVALESGTTPYEPPSMESCPLTPAEQAILLQKIREIGAFCHSENRLACKAMQLDDNWKNILLDLYGYYYGLVHNHLYTEAETPRETLLARCEATLRAITGKGYIACVSDIPFTLDNQEFQKSVNHYYLSYWVCQSKEMQYDLYILSSQLTLFPERLSGHIDVVRQYLNLTQFMRTHGESGWQKTLYCDTPEFLDRFSEALANAFTLMGKKAPSQEALDMLQSALLLCTQYCTTQLQKYTSKTPPETCHALTRLFQASICLSHVRNADTERVHTLRTCFEKVYQLRKRLLVDTLGKRLNPSCLSIQPKTVAETATRAPVVKAATSVPAALPPAETAAPMVTHAPEPLETTPAKGITQKQRDKHRRQQLHSAQTMLEILQENLAAFTAKDARASAVAQRRQNTRDALENTIYTLATQLAAPCDDIQTLMAEAQQHARLRETAQQALEAAHQEASKAREDLLAAFEEEITLLKATSPKTVVNTTKIRADKKEKQQHFDYARTILGNARRGLAAEILKETLALSRLRLRMEEEIAALNPQDPAATEHEMEMVSCDLQIQEPEPEPLSSSSLSHFALADDFIPMMVLDTAPDFSTLLEEKSETINQLWHNYLRAQYECWIYQRHVEAFEQATIQLEHAIIGVEQQPDRALSELLTQRKQAMESRTIEPLEKQYHTLHATFLTAYKAFGEWLGEQARSLLPQAGNQPVLIGDAEKTYFRTMHADYQLYLKIADTPECLAEDAPGIMRMLRLRANGDLLLSKAMQKWLRENAERTLRSASPQALAETLNIVWSVYQTGHALHLHQTICRYRLESLLFPETFTRRRDPAFRKATAQELTQLTATHESERNLSRLHHLLTTPAESPKRMALDKNRLFTVTALHTAGETSLNSTPQLH